MADFKKQDFRKLIEKYGGAESFESGAKEVTSVEYERFKEAFLPRQLDWYEEGCAIADKIFTLAPPKDRTKWNELQGFIDICHMSVTPSSVQAFAFMLPTLIMVIGAAASYIIFNSMFFAMFFIIAGAAMIYPLLTLPKFLANSWRLRASNQMVLCVFYIVTYMRHTSNLELAIAFAADHLGPPLSLDMRKVIWDVETEKFASLKESLENYLETWRKYNLEFIEAIHLIESSLYEGSNERRLNLLDKSLDVILTETYEKMLHYAHSLQSPITALHMLGVILPVLGLVILPLVVSFMGNVEWYHIATLYNLILPGVVFYMGKKILSSRPTGYGSVDISAASPEYKKLQNYMFKMGDKVVAINPAYIAAGVMIVCFALGMVPLILGMTTSTDALLAEGELIENSGFKLLEYRMSVATEGPKAGVMLGPYGVGASLFSFFIPLGMGVGMGLYFIYRTRALMSIRDGSKRLETEFASALFQLGNRLGDGVPVERAVGDVAEIMTDTVSGQFFEQVSKNIMRLGYGIEDAIFHPKYGALVSTPSAVISSSMKVLVESVRKGPAVAAESMINISRYIKEIHRVDERLKDMLAEILSSMKSQITFMAPAISGIVIGITSMITGILGKLREKATEIQTGAGTGGNLSLFTQLFGDAIPPYFFQLVVGIYVVEIVMVLAILANSIENGEDKLNEQNSMGKYLKKSTILYVVIGFIVTILFSFISGQVVSKTVSAS